MRLAPMPFPTLFQFHKGTIKTIFSKLTGADIIGFQFHKGTIKTKEFIIMT